jgi:hypothetical protein
MNDPDAQRLTVMNDIIRDLGIKGRKSWGASAPVRSLVPDWNYNSIVVHNTGHGFIDTMAKIQKFDLSQRHWDDIAYHYGIMPDGTIFEGRQLIYKGSDIRNQNTGKIGIVCIGDYDASMVNWFSGRAYTGDPIWSAMMDSLKKLTLRLSKDFRILFFGGHIEYGDTTDCPGNELLPRVQKMRKELGFSKPIKRSGP